MSDDTYTTTGDDEPQPDRPADQELALKMLGAHALVDPAFFERLQVDPVAAAAELRIALTTKDLEYLAAINWGALAPLVAQARLALPQGQQNVAGSW